MFGGVIAGEQITELSQSSVDLADRRLRPRLLERGEGSGLHPMEEHERPILLMRERPLLVRRMFPHEVHEGQAVIGVLGGPMVFPQRQPAEPTVVELHELPIRFSALLLRQPERTALPDHLADEIVVVGLGAVRPQAIRPQVGLHLQKSHVHPHLKHLAAVPGFEQTGVDLAGLKIPVLEEDIDVAGRCHGSHSLPVNPNRGVLATRRDYTNVHARSLQARNCRSGIRLCRRAPSVFGSPAQPLRLGPMTFGVETLAFRGPGCGRAAAGLRHDHRPFQEVREFFQTVGDVSRLITVPLAGDHERPIAVEAGPLTLQQPPPHVVGQVRRMDGIEPEHGLAAGAVDVLPPRAAAPRKLPLERRRWYQQRTDADFLFLGHRFDRMGE